MNRAVRQTGLDIEIARDYESLSRRAADLLIQELQQQPNLLLCASAGGTPTRTYELLSQHALRRPALFQKIRVLQIDEWLGLHRQHQASCALDLHRKLIQPLKVPPSRYTGFRCDTADPKNECRRIAAWLARHGPIDVCILGLGANGHVAMNEPADSLVPGVHLARLAKSSQQHALLAGLAHKPRFGLTLGLGDILRSRKILLLVNGRPKRAAVRMLLRPVVTTRFPASLLRLHPNATLLCDRCAASTIK